MDALGLMRSRYAAYSLKLADYIMDTTHASNPSYDKNRDKWKEDILQFCRDTKFEGLQIVEFTEGLENAYVTFTAILKNGNRDISFTEKSRFVKENDRWLYHSGTITQKKG